MAYIMGFPEHLTKLGGETMEKNNNGKMVAIVALVVAVVALSVGFAAFADDLYINGTATVEANGNAFDATSGTDLRYQANSNKCYLTDDTSKTAIAGANVGTLSEDVWNGIQLPLGAEATSVTCEAIVENNSAYIAYLKSLAASSGLSCSSTGANATANETNVCGATTLTVSIGSDNISVTNAAVTNSSTSGSIAAKSGSTPGTATVIVTVAYAGAITDEDVTITLPTITHHYSSTNGS